MVFIFRLCLIFFIGIFLNINGRDWPFFRAVTFSFKKKKVIRSKVFFKKELYRQYKNHLFNIDECFNEWHAYCQNCDVLNSPVKKRSKMIRVLIDESRGELSAEWKFTAQKGFVLRLAEQKNAKKIIVKRDIVVVIKKGQMFFNGKKVTKAVRLTPIEGHVYFNGVAYDGDFFIVPYKHSFLCINSVELEDYITAVLKTESWPGWPLEINKVFAIACRSYVIHKKLEALRTKLPYHVKNSNAHQTYKGRHDLRVLKDAVEQTKGVVIAFKNKPILAMFDCCCGGIIPAGIEGFDFNKAPYLARTYACTHCKQSSLYAWKISYDRRMFEDIIKLYKHEIGQFFGIHIMQKDKAGLVKEVKLRGLRSVVTISGKKLYSLLKDVKSFSFDIVMESNQIIFLGRGFGHHLGLCQWGARQMIRDGWGYKSILLFYYPGTKFMQLL